MSSPPSPDPEFSPVRTAAIIGISNYGRQHLLMALEQMLHGRLRLVAATVVNRQDEGFFCERLQRLGCEIFDQVDAMWEVFSGRIDVCFIPTGIHLHAAMTVQALRAGASVLVEKPLAASLAQAAEMARAEAETGRFVAVGFQDLFTDSTWLIKQLILDGRLGELRAASLTGLWPREARYYRRNGWAGRLEHAGQLVRDSPVSNAFSHFLNLALFWAGPALDVSAQVRLLECELYRTRPIESFDTCCARAVLSGGCELRFYLTHSCKEERRPTLILEGSRAALAWVQESHYEITDASGAVERHAVPGKFENKFMMADAVSARLAGLPARICSPAIAREHLRLVEAIHTGSQIFDVPPEALRLTAGPNGGSVAIVGIEEACDEASRRHLLWSELALPWARPATALRL